jgi:pimeloyl-ACP methyl ester carboxylesterase
MYHRYLITAVLGILLTGCTPLPTQAAEQQDPKEAPKGVRITPDVVYGHKFGMALTFDMFQPKKQNGAGIIYIQSGGWHSIWGPLYKQTPTGLRSLTREELIGREKALGATDFNILLARGFTIFEVRHGSSPKFNMAEIVGDLRRAVRFIRFHARKYGVDPERLGLWGGSAGGHLALLLGTTSEVGIPKPTKIAELLIPNAPEEVEKCSGRVAAVVALCPPSVLQRPKDPIIMKIITALDMKDEQYREFSPLYFVSPDDPPTLLIHGEKDTDVPISLSESMHQALLKAGVKTKLVKIPNAGHSFFDKDADQVLRETLSWFEEHLKVK